MKKLLATVSATLLLAGSLLSSTALAAVEEKEVWKFSEGVTTDAATQTFSMGAVEYAIRSTPIDFTAEDLDIQRKTGQNPWCFTIRGCVITTKLL